MIETLLQAVQYAGMALFLWGFYIHWKHVPFGYGFGWNGRFRDFDMDTDFVDRQQRRAIIRCFGGFAVILLTSAFLGGANP